MRGQNVCFYLKIRKIFPKLFMLPLLIWSTGPWDMISLNVLKSLNQLMGSSISDGTGRLKVLHVTSRAAEYLFCRLI